MGNSGRYVQMDGKEQRTCVWHVPRLLTHVLPCPIELHLQDARPKIKMIKNFKMVKVPSVRSFCAQTLVQWHNLQADPD